MITVVKCICGCCDKCHLNLPQCLVHSVLVLHFTLGDVDSQRTRIANTSELILVLQPSALWQSWHWLSKMVRCVVLSHLQGDSCKEGKRALCADMIFCSQLFLLSVMSSGNVLGWSCSVVRCVTDVHSCCTWGCGTCWVIDPNRIGVYVHTVQCYRGCACLHTCISIKSTWKWVVLCSQWI